MSGKGQITSKIHDSGRLAKLRFIAPRDTKLHGPGNLHGDGGHLAQRAMGTTGKVSKRSNSEQKTSEDTPRPFSVVTYRIHSESTSEATVADLVYSATSLRLNCPFIETKRNMQVVHLSSEAARVHRDA